MEFPGLYGDLQTGFEPIKFLDTRSVWVSHVIKEIIEILLTIWTFVFFTEYQQIHYANDMKLKR